MKKIIYVLLLILPAGSMAETIIMDGNTLILPSIEYSGSTYKLELELKNDSNKFYFDITNAQKSQDWVRELNVSTYEVTAYERIAYSETSQLDDEINQANIKFEIYCKEHLYPGLEYLNRTDENIYIYFPNNISKSVPQYLDIALAAATATINGTTAPSPTSYNLEYSLNESEERSTFGVIGGAGGNKLYLAYEKNYLVSQLINKIKGNMVTFYIKNENDEEMSVTYDMTEAGQKYADLKYDCEKY